MDPNEIINEREEKRVAKKFEMPYMIKKPVREFYPVFGRIVEQCKLLWAFLFTKLRYLKNVFVRVKIDRTIHNALGTFFHWFMGLFSTKTNRRRIYSYDDARIYERYDEPDERGNRRSYEKSHWCYRPESQNTSSEDEGTVTLMEEESISIGSTAESSRLHQLEMELVELRKQMAMLLANQGVIRPCEDVSEGSLQSGINSNRTVSPVMATKRVPPPAPPPPPPSFLKTQPPISAIKPTDLQGLKHFSSNEFSRSAPVNNNPHANSNNVSMKDVLKELNKVHLKPVPKSPGGTPYIRTRSTLGSDNTSPSSTDIPASCDSGTLLVKAMLKIRKNIRLSESYHGSDNECSTDEEDLWQ